VVEKPGKHSSQHLQPYRESKSLTLSESLMNTAQRNINMS